MFIQEYFLDNTYVLKMNFQPKDSEMPLEKAFFKPELRADPEASEVLL